MVERQIDSRFRGNDGEGEAPPWVTEFLATLIMTGSVREAVGEAGIEFETAWALRQEEPVFAMYWDRAVRVQKGVAACLAASEADESAGATVH